MAFDEGLAERIRAVLDARADVDERRCSAASPSSSNGNMACGVMNDDLMVRMDRPLPRPCETEAGARAAPTWAAAP